MRVLLLAFLICLPLTASDDPVLDRAVRLFRSDDADVREGASRVAHAHIHKVLAPLVAALEDPEPEVRRRARDAIQSLLPHTARIEENKDTSPVQQWQALFQRKARGNVVFVAKNGRLIIEARPQDPKAKRAAGLLLEMGLEAQQVSKTLRKQLRLAEGQGFEVTSVKGRAARLGLKESDLVLRVNGKVVDSAVDLLEALGEKPDWKKVSLRVLRNGKPIEIGGQKT